MSRYNDRSYNDSYYDDEDYDDGGYSYGDSYASSYRSRGSNNHRRRDYDSQQQRHQYRSNNNHNSSSLRHRGGGPLSNGGMAGSSARIHPQDGAAVRNNTTSLAVNEYDEYYNSNMNNGDTQMVPLNNNNIQNNSTKNKLADFDSYTSDAEKLSAILRVADVELHKHALTAEYYTLRKYSILVPIIVLSLFVAMAGFIAASDIVTEKQRVHDATMQEFLTLIVASSGFIVLLLTLLGNQLDYASRIRFHDGAREDLKSLCEKMRMYRVERAMDERVVEEEMAEIRRKEMELGELDVGDTESDESEVDEEEDEEDLLDEEQGGGGGGGGNGGWDTVVQMNTGEYPPTLHQTGDGTGAIIAHSEGGGLMAGSRNTNNISQRKQAAMERKIARQARKQLKLSKKLEKKNEYLTKELVNQKITQERQQQEMSKDVITFYGYHAELHQIISGCKSDVPPEISKFFHVMENRVELMSLSRLGIQEESRMRKNQIIRLCASEIYNEIQGFVLWPVTVPPVDSTIEASLRTVGQLLNMDYRAQRRCKLIPCCPVPLCCKKRTSNNIFAVINEGIDQRELDMMQAERVEVLRQVNERKARLMAGPAEVLELKDEESVKAPVASKKPPKDPMAWVNEQNTVQQQLKDYADFGDGYSRATIDPDGSVMNEIMTEVSDPKVAIRNGVNDLGLYVHDEEEDGDEDGTGGGTGGGTFEGVAPAPKSEVYSQAISQQLSQSMIQQERQKAEKKAKKKKKKKQKKKNKKKSKKKAKAKKEESDAGSEYSDEEYDDDEYGDASYGEEDERSYSQSEDSGSY